MALFPRLNEWSPFLPCRSSAAVGLRLFNLLLFALQCVLQLFRSKFFLDGGICANECDPQAGLLAFKLLRMIATQLQLYSGSLVLKCSLGVPVCKPLATPKPRPPPGYEA